MFTALKTHLKKHLFDNHMDLTQFYKIIFKTILLTFPKFLYV